MTLLDVQNLRIEYSVKGQPVVAVGNLSFRIKHGYALGLMGESGSGKTSVANAIVGLLPPDSRVTGTMNYQGTDLLSLAPTERATFRGSIALAVQETYNVLSPVYPVGRLLLDTLELHRKRNKVSDPLKFALTLLQKMGVPDPENVMASIGFELSGGIRQRAILAIALACQPDLLIVDEPTSNLDTTIRHQILELLQTIIDERKMAFLFISHDQAAIEQICDDSISIS